MCRLHSRYPSSGRGSGHTGARSGAPLAPGLLQERGGPCRASSRAGGLLFFSRSAGVSSARHSSNAEEGVGSSLDDVALRVGSPRREAAAATATVKARWRLVRSGSPETLCGWAMAGQASPPPLPLPSPSPLSPLMVMYHIISRSSAAGTRLGSLFEDCLPRSCASSAGAPSSRLVLAWLAVLCCWGVLCLDGR